MDSLNQKLPANFWKTALSVAGAGVVSRILWNYYHRDNKLLYIPEKWANVAQVYKLIIYPVKSCHGVEVESATLTKLGLKASKYLRDRAFSVVDSRGSFLTQRQHPNLALVSVSINGDSITFSAPTVPSITIEMGMLEGSPEKYCRIWQDKLKVIDCGDAIAEWFDSLLNQSGFRLVYYPSNEQKRNWTSQGANVKKFPNFSPTDLGIFHDDTAYMLMAQESVAALKDKVGSSDVSYKSFRPVILVDGLREPFAEDYWTYIRFQNREMGPVLKNCIPCSRCRITTIDQDNGTVDAEGQPLKTLTTMTRKFGNEKVNELVKKNAVIGANYGLFDGEGLTINVGDQIFAALL